MIESNAAFRPAWWARAGLVQTLVARAPSAPAPAWRTELWPTPDDDELRVHFVGPDDPTKPIVLALHGLEGSRDSVYVAEAARCAAEHGLRFCLLEFRSCGGVLNRARRTYHSGETSDLGFVAARLAARFPLASLVVLGWSLGGNVLLKWLGEIGDRGPGTLRVAAAISPPFDLDASATRCDTRYGGRIARVFLDTLIPKALAKERQHPGLCDPDAVRRCRTLRAFDDAFTAPAHGFQDAAHYYRTQSCGPFVPAIRVPTLVVASLDDPLCDAGAIPRDALAAASSVRAVLPRRGGHVAFVAGGAPWRPRRWAEGEAMRFVTAQLSGIA